MILKQLSENYARCNGPYNQRLAVTVDRSIYFINKYTNELNENDYLALKYTRLSEFDC